MDDLLEFGLDILSEKNPTLAWLIVIAITLAILFYLSVHRKQ